MVLSSVRRTLAAAARRVPRACWLAGLGLGLAGCQSMPWTTRFLDAVHPYQVEIVQGNVVTREQVALVKPGMNRAQVRDVLGSPLLADAFHAERWDYVFTIRRQGAQPQSRRIVVLFSGDVFQSLDTGGDLPSEQEFVASIDTFKTLRNARPLELTPEQAKALPPPAKPATIEVEPIGANRDYPPLEPST